MEEGTRHFADPVIGNFMLPGGTTSRFAQWAVLLTALLSVHVAVTTDHQREPEAAIFISEPPSHVTLSNVKGILIPCSAYGYPAPEMDWVHIDGSPVDHIPGLLEIFPNNSLYLHPFQDAQFRPEVHSGKYRCLATNMAGVLASRVMSLNAVLLNQYKSYNLHVNDVFVTSGNTAVFECAINPYYMRQYVRVLSWTGSGTTITSGGRYSVLSSGDLHVRSVSAQDSYQSYRCITRNDLTGEEKASEPASLYFIEPVNSSPAIEDTVPVLQVDTGENLELPCAASGFPLPAYSWTKDGGSLVLDQTHLAQFGGNLAIRRARAGDSGEYKCIARNDMGQAAVVTNLTVRAPLSAYIDPAQQTVDVGNPAIFNCTPSGHPQKSVTWLKNGQPLVTDGRVQLTSPSLLLISTVQRMDRGVFQCVVSNDRDNAQGSAQLSLGVSRPLILRAYEDSFTRPGPTVSFTCTVAGNPTPTVRWLRDDAALPTDDRYRVEVAVTSEGDVISNVTIRNVQVEDGGEFQCQAVNSIGETDFAARLNVYGAPYIRPMANVTAVSNERLVIRCHVSGYPISGVVWHKGTSILPINHRQHVTDEGILEIEAVTRSADDGVYTCTASNPDGQSVSASLHVHILEPPLIDAFAFPSRKDGDRVSVSCVVSSGDLPIQITWYKDGRPIPRDLGVIIQMTGDYSSMLSIGHASPRHNGNYTCLATNMASSSNLTASFHVDVPPRWITEPQDTFVILHKSIRLDCQTSGTPEPTVRWERARGEGPGDYVGIDFQHPGSSHLVQLANGSLLIGQAREEDHGYYLCRSTNEVGSALSKVVFLTVHVPSRFEGPMRNQTVVIRRNTTLECEAVGDTPMSMSWSRNGTPLDLPNGNRISVSYHYWERGRGTRLHLQAARRSDSGFYVCHAQNMFGSDALMIQLLVQEPPEAPSALRIRTSNSRSVVITWSAPFEGNSPIQAYVVQFHNASDDWDRAALIHVEADDHYALVDNLHPAYEYNIRVLANNSIGLGEPSDVITVITGQEAPTGPPNDVHAIAIGSQNMLITWQPPYPAACNGQILGYYIGYKKFNVTSPYMYVTKATAGDFVPEVEIRNLDKFTMYSVHVQAYNVKGAGPRSADITVLTLEDVPSQPPQGIQVTPLSSQSLMLLWSPPPLYTLHGVLQGYKVFLKQVRDDEDERDTVIMVTTKLSSAIYGLEKFTNYSVQVAAYTRQGEGVPSRPVYIKTLPDFPDRPADIKALPAGPDAILVSWRPPLHVNGRLLKYLLVIEPMDEENETHELEVELPPETESYLATKLSPRRRYRFKVRAATQVGYGEFTHEVTVSPRQEVTAQIASFSHVIEIPYRDDVTLPCIAVGDPVPVITWRKGKQPVVSSPRIQVLPNGSLSLRRLTPADGGNYSCRAENAYGADEMTMGLIVQAPPQAPTLEVAMTTVATIQVTWLSGSNGGSRIQGFILSHKRDHGDWHKEVLSAGNRSHTLRDLRCGTKYRFRLAAFNSVGEGQSSGTLMAKTNGSAPIMPSQNLLINELNSTYVTLSLDTWLDAGCPVTSFDIRYRVWGQEEWETVENHIDPSKRFYTIDLHPATWYVVKVTAHNEAGSTDCVIKFATTAFGGSTVQPMKIIHRNALPIHQRPDIMIPLIGCIVLFVVVIVALVLFYKRRHNKLSYKEENASNLRRDLTAETSLTIEADKQLSSDYGQRNQHYTPLPASDWRRNQEPRDTRVLNNDDETTENPYATYIYGSENVLDRRRSDVTKGAADGGKYDALTVADFRDPRYQNSRGPQVATISSSSLRRPRPTSLPGVKRHSTCGGYDQVPSQTYDYARTLPNYPRQTQSRDPRLPAEGNTGTADRPTYARFTPYPPEQNDDSEDHPIYEQFSRPRSGAYEYISQSHPQAKRKRGQPGDVTASPGGSSSLYGPRVTLHSEMAPLKTVAFIDSANGDQIENEEQRPLVSKREPPGCVKVPLEKTKLLDRRYQHLDEGQDFPDSSLDGAHGDTSPYRDDFTVV